ncbi:phage baseplate assembly protein V [Malaciobacter marinus]|uniref:phage baseplate assembly protein V n=1 Tax=Malaciobacter marinus TaxID=505249 RepID=UPI003B00D8F4
MSLRELLRRIENIVQVGTISVTKSSQGKALAKVIVHDDGEDKRVTKFLPVLSFANSFAKVWFPIKVGEQVLVISPFGNANSGFIIRSIFNRACKEPHGANEHTTIVEFEDKTRFVYDSKSKKFEVDCVGDITLKAGGNIKIEAAGDVDIDGSRIDLN